MNIRKFAIAFAACAAISAYAQDDEVTSFEDFDEPVVESSATNGDANGNASDARDNAAVNGTASTSATSEEVTKLDLLSVETESEAEQAAIAKQVETVSTIDAAELQNTSKSVSKAINSASGVKVRKSGGMGSEGKINIRGMEGKNIKVLVNGVPVETQGNLGLDDIPIDQIADIEVYKGYIPARFATDGAGGSASSEDVTKLDLLSVETESEAEQAAIAKQVETVSTIDAAELQNTSKSISKAINSASGVKVRKSGGMGSEGKINIRGMEGKNIKVLVNGVPVETQGNLGIDDIPIDQIADIEVYKGYIPARFATDGAGGAINIVTKKRPANSIDASYSFSSFNTHKASVSASHLIDSVAGAASLEIGVSGYFNHSDNDYEFTSPYMKSSTGKDTSVVRDHDHYTSYNVQAFANLMNAWFDKISLGASFGAFDKEIQGIEYRIKETTSEGYNFGVSLGLDKKDFFAKNLNLGDYFSFGFAENKIIDTSRVHCRNWFSCDVAKKNVGELTSMGLPKLRTVEIYDFNNLLNLDYQYVKDQFVYLNTLLRYHKENPEDDLGSEKMGFNTAGLPGEMFSVTTGISLENRFWNSRIQNLAGFKFHYLNAKISNMPTSLLIEPAVESNDYTDFSYDENLMFKIAKSLSVKASYQHAVRLPSPEELFGDGLRVSAAINLKPEEADNFNFGISVDLQELPLVTRLRFDGDVFYSYYKNRIHYMSSSQMSIPYFNMNPIRSWGYEGDVKLDVNEWVLLGTNWTFQDLRNIKSNARQGIPKDAIVPNIPRFFMNYLVEYHVGDLFSSEDFLKVWWSANYTDEYFYGWKISSRQSRKIKASFTQDIGVEYSLWDNKLGWSFEVDNITDSESFDKFGESKPGRSFATKIRYSFR